MIKLINGDCLEEMDKLLDNENMKGKIDLVVCDLPYGITANDWDKPISFNEIWKRLNLLTKKEAAVCLFGVEPFSSRLRLSNIDSYRYDWIFRKSVVTGYQNANKMPMREHEIISVFYRSLPTYNPQNLKIDSKTKRGGSPSRLSENWGEINNDPYIQRYTNYPKSIIGGFGIPNHYHPTEKPVPLIEYLIKTYSNEGDLVLDMTMGAGGAAIACRNLNRNFIGIELNENYFNIANDRLNGVI